MTTSAAPKLAGFFVALAALFGIGALAGGLIDPSPPSGAAAKAKPAQKAGAGAMSGMATQATGGEQTSMGVRGLAVAENGLRLVVDGSRFQRGRTQDLRFRIVDGHGQPVRKFDVEHTKRMHLIVVRRDFTGFQHLHPVEDARGNWTMPLRLEDPGSYRMFADFSYKGDPMTLADDLTVDGPFATVPLPRPASTTTTDGFQVQLDASHVAAGDESALRFTVTRDGRPVKVEPYLGADGHLVALREGDLAFLHVHPTGGQGDHGITFDATFPTTADYRLFLQFKVGGRVHTAAFTQVVS